MRRRTGIVLIVGFAILAGCLFQAIETRAEEKKDMGGWEKGGTYDQHYNATELDKIKVTIVKLLLSWPDSS